MRAKQNNFRRQIGARQVRNRIEAVHRRFVMEPSLGTSEPDLLDSPNRGEVDLLGLREQERARGQDGDEEQDNAFHHWPRRIVAPLNLAIAAKLV